MIQYTARAPLPLQPASALYAHLGIVVITVCFLPNEASLQIIFDECDATKSLLPNSCSCRSKMPAVKPLA